jgi:PPIC-type PPIASE domain
LLTFDGGTVTLEDWFVALCEIVPPSRPNVTQKPEAVEGLLEAAVQIPLLVSEAKSLGLDKNEQFLQQQKAYEDNLLLGKIQQDKYDSIKQPTQEQITAYFDKNSELFRQDRALKIEQIWLKDLSDARLAKAELDKGVDFNSVRKKYSLEKDASAVEVSAGSEGLFWLDLWKGQAGQTIGPVKGFYEGQLKWRIVKILEKRQGQLQKYSADMNNTIIMIMMTEQTKSLFISYGNELLGKYSYEIYKDKIKDIDPLNIP